MRELSPQAFLSVKGIYPRKFRSLPAGVDLIATGTPLAEWVRASPTKTNVPCYVVGGRIGDAQSSHFPLIIT
jgi:hypothetical protein